MLFAIVSASGAVVNIIVAQDGDPCPVDGASLVAVPDGLPVDQNWSYIDGEWIAPPPPPDAPPRRAQ